MEQLRLASLALLLAKASNQPSASAALLKAKQQWDRDQCQTLFFNIVFHPQNLEYGKISTEACKVEANYVHVSVTYYISLNS